MRERHPGTIDRRDGAEIINTITKAFENGLNEWKEWSAFGYRITADILDGWGESAAALEYYGYALQCDAQIEAASRRASLRHQEHLENEMNKLARMSFPQRAAIAARFGTIQCFYRRNDEQIGPISIWQVLDLIDSGVLPMETKICLTGSDYWRYAVSVLAGQIKP
jgi:hypothetical protein